MQRTPREREFLLWLIMMNMGAMIASTGTFAKLGMGSWSGPEVRIAGWLLLGVSLCAIFYCVQKLQPYGNGHYFLLTMFGLSVIIGAVLFWPSVTWTFGPFVINQRKRREVHAKETS